MRYLLHFGMLVLAFGAVSRADAQEHRRGERRATVVVTSGGGSRVTRLAYTPAEPRRAVYDSRRVVHRPSRAAYDARRVYVDQRQDLAQIVQIAQRWEEASAKRDRYLQAKVDRRIDAWLEREIRESVREPRNHRHADRLRLLSNELAKLDRKRSRGYSQHGRGHHGYGNAGRGHRGDSQRKAEILNELVWLSERQVQRARASMQTPFRLSFARR